MVNMYTFQRMRERRPKRKGKRRERRGRRRDFVSPTEVLHIP